MSRITKQSRSETLTRAEIEACYPLQWILVDQPETDDQLEVVRGTVLFHSKDRDRVYNKAVELKPKHFAVLYTGKMPEDAVIVL